MPIPAYNWAMEGDKWNQLLDKDKNENGSGGHCGMRMTLGQKEAIGIVFSNQC